MAKAQQAMQQTNVTPLQYNGVSPLRATRIAAVKHALHMRHLAAKHAKHSAATIAAEQAATAAANLAAYQAQVAALAQQYGIAATKAQSSNAGAIAKLPKAGTTCYQVWVLAKAHGFVRAATLAACAAANINKATAATQFALANRAQGTY